MKQKIHYLFMLLLMIIVGAGGAKAETVKGELAFGTNDVKINAASVTANDNKNNSWTITTVGTTSFTQNGAYSQVGSSSKPATSITFTTTLSENVKVTFLKGRFGGFSGTAGTVTLKVDDTTVGTGSLNATNDVNVTTPSDFTGVEGKTLTITVTGISKGVKCYQLNYTYETLDGPSLTSADLAFAEDSYTAILGEDFTAPTLTNPYNLSVTYDSDNTDVATVDANSGAVTLVGAGSTTITASFAGNDTYAAGEASYELTVEAPFVIEDGVFNFEAKKSDYGSEVETTTDANTYVTESKTWTAGNVTLVTSGKYRWWDKDGTLRFYSNSPQSAMTISVPDGKVITKIELEGENSFSANVGTLNSGKWEGSSNSVVLTCTVSKGSVNVRKITVTYGDAPADPTSEPTISLAAGIYFETQTVTLSCATGGATIYYTLDGTEPTAESTEYTGAISISETTTLKAIAVKDGQSSNVVSATYTIPTTYTTIAAFKDAKTSACLNLTGAQVVYIDEAKKNIYVRDASAAICLYNNDGFTFEDNKELKAGDILSGIIYGKYSLYNNLPEITDIQNFDKLTVTDNTDVTPKAVASKEEIAANMCDLVKITKAQISETDNKYYVLGVQLYDKLKLGYEPVTGVNANITGVVTDYKSETEIFPRTAGDIVYYPAAPTFSPVAGEVEKGTSVTITAEEDAKVKYTIGETTTTAGSNTVTVTINEDVTIKAVAVKDGVESEEVSAAYTVKAEEPVVEPGTPAAITAGFYTIKNLGNEKFVNVAGRKTATLVDNAEGMAGTVIQVESDADGIVKTLRSQGVDVPGYATRAMKYVPDVVKLVVEKLHVSGSGEILGETGVDKILDKFNKSVDVNLHVVHADGGYRIYGKTPSMTPVKEFYQENKANVDAKLPGLEQAINDAIATIVDKVGKGESLKNTFKLETIWKRMGWTDYEPGTEETTQVAFLQQVLANEENIWNFAYQTAMFYMEWVEGKQAFQEMQEKAPELMKYWNLAKKVRPNFMYYIVQKDDKVDVISQGNEAILNNDKSTVWALEEVSEFKVNLTTSVEKTVYPTSKDGETTSYTEYYGTLYTDFAYRLPEGVTAYKVTGINTVGDKAYVKKAELNSEVVPAQTPVLLIANTGELTLTIAEGGEAVADNQLYGNDYLINEYDINTPQLEGVFNLLAELSQSTYDKYEYLMRKNAGTVNNKYFFGIAVEGELNEAYYAKTGKEMESSPVLKLGLTDGKVGFFETWDNLAGNEGFMFSEEVSEILMNIVGDVNRDGTITISDVTALVNIILGKATYPADADKYDFEAADVNTDKTITISDVTALVNIILGKTQN